MKRWRAFDAPSFTRRRDYMRDASRPRTGDYPWHDPQWEEIPVDTQTIAPAPVAASGPVASGPADEKAARAVRREKRNAERQERAVWWEERAGGPSVVQALREYDCDEGWREPWPPRAEPAVLTHWRHMWGCR